MSLLLSLTFHTSYLHVNTLTKHVRDGSRLIITTASFILILLACQSLRMWPGRSAVINNCSASDRSRCPETTPVEETQTTVNLLQSSHFSPLCGENFSFSVRLSAPVCEDTSADLPNGLSTLCLLFTPPAVGLHLVAMVSVAQTFRQTDRLGGSGGCKRSWSLMKSHVATAITLNKPCFAADFHF